MFVCYKRGWRRVQVPVLVMKERKAQKNWKSQFFILLILFILAGLYGHVLSQVVLL